jgi:hypothetical protein
MAKKNITKYNAQKQLALFWFIGVGLYIVLFLVVSGFRTNPGTPSEHLEWLITYIGPALSLITSTFVYSANNRPVLENKKIDIFFFRLVLFASLFYLVFLFIILISTPSAERRNISFISHLKSFSLILGFIQTTLAVLLGIFFVKEE